MSLVSAWSIVLALDPDPVQARAEVYRDHRLVEVWAPDGDALARLLALQVDPWQDTPRPGWVPLRVSPQVWPSLLAGAWSLRVLDDDLAESVAQEGARLALRTPGQAGGDFFTDFHTLDEIDAWLDAYVAGNPELASITEVGSSIEGRTIRALRIAAAGDDPRPGVIVTAGQHAREWVSVSSALYVADQLATRAAEPEIAAMLAAVTITIVPVVNPDGYVYTWTDERLWRKNRRDGIGVDTNRNWGVGWGGEGASLDPAAENYAGSAAFSEPETEALREWIEADDALVAHVDVHSFGELVLYPWGHLYEVTDDDATLSATATDIADAMSAFGEDYTPLQGVNLYPAAGNAIDWTYGAAELFAYTMELRPNFNAPEAEQGFVIAPEQIVAVGDEVFAGLWVVLQSAATPSEAGDTSTGGVGSSTGDGASSGDVAASSTGAADSSGGTGGSGGEGTSTGTTAALDDGSTTSGAAADADTGGCSCDQRGTARPWAALWLLLALRRRRVTRGAR
ncbi:MAG: hypothetical protein K1X88_25130, partial [Nannocystaceae bacterium]|nr:hypothetical protein [Nannocystaceae bacterium]